MVGYHQNNQANRELRAVEELEAEFKNNPSSDVFFSLVEIYLRRGQPLKAVAACQKSSSSSTLEGRILLARAYFDASAVKRTYLQNAAQEVDGILSQNPDSWEAFRLKGEISLENENLQGAIDALRKAHELNPHHPQARMLLQSLGQEVQVPIDGSENDYYVNVDTNYTPPETDSVVKTVRDVALFVIVVIIGVYMYASNSVFIRRTQALVTLGRTQQRLETQSGLRHAAKIYNVLTKQFDSENPYGLIHQAETYYSLWKNHTRSDSDYKQFRHYYSEIQKGSKNYLNRLAIYHALVALIGFDNAEKQLQKGEVESATKGFEALNGYIQSWVPKLPPHARLNWVHGLIYEKLRKGRHAAANLKRAAELGWNSPIFRWRYGYHFYRKREYAFAHAQFKQAIEQGQQAVSLVANELADENRQKNSYCWIDPPMLLGQSAPPGLELSVWDMLIESSVAAVNAVPLTPCSYHPALQNAFKGNKHYFPASVDNILAVLEAGVGMAAAYIMYEELMDIVKKIKTDKKMAHIKADLSPYIRARLSYLTAKIFWFQGRYKKSQSHLDTALSLSKAEAGFFSLKGMLLGKEKKWDEALKAFKVAFNLEPYLLQPYYEAAGLLLDAGAEQNERVEELLGYMVKNFKGHSDYYYLAGRLASNKKDQPKAIELWKKALDPKKGPYYGDHYEANIELGKIEFTDSRRVRKLSNDREPDRVLLREEFKKHKDKIITKIQEDVEDSDFAKAKGDFIKFVTGARAGKKFDKVEFNEFKPYLTKVYDEAAGKYFQTAIKSRPGASDGRYRMGKLWFANKSWSDSYGHFSVAASGYLRDQNYKMATKAFTYLLKATIKTKDTPKEGVKAVIQYFQAKAKSAASQGLIKVQAKQNELIAEDKKAEAKKYKAKQSTRDHTAATFKVMADTVKTIPALGSLSNSLRAQAKIIKTKGYIAWGILAARRAIAARRRAAAPAPSRQRRRRRRR